MKTIDGTCGDCGAKIDGIVTIHEPDCPTIVHLSTSGPSMKTITVRAAVACENCRFAEEIGEHMACRRNPPILYGIKPRFLRWRTTLYQTAHPIVKRKDWCGEHITAEIPIREVPEIQAEVEDGG